MVNKICVPMEDRGNEEMLTRYACYLIAHLCA